MSTLSLIATSNFITVNRTIAGIVGLEAAAVLGELASESLYWQENNPSEDGWFFSTVENLEKRTYLSAHSQRLALNKLQEQGWISVEKRGMPAKRYIRIHEDQIARVVNNKSLKFLTTSDKNFEQQDVKIFNTNKKKDKKNIEEEKREEIKAPTVVNNSEPENRTEDKIDQALGILAGAFPYIKGKISEDTRATWLQEFKDTDPEILIRAVRNHISTCRYFPSPAEINEQIKRAYLTAVPEPTKRQQESQHQEQSNEEDKVDDFLKID